MCHWGSQWEVETVFALSEIIWRTTGTFLKHQSRFRKLRWGIWNRTRHSKQCGFCVFHVQGFLDAHTSIAPAHVRSPSVGDTFQFPFYQRLWVLYVKSWRKRTPIIFKFCVWVGFPKIDRCVCVCVFDPKTFFWPKNLFDPKNFFDPKKLFDP